MLVLAHGENEHVLFRKRIRDPRLEYVDFYNEETWERYGGQRYVDNTSFAVSMPYNDYISYLTLSAVFDGKAKVIGPIQIQ